MQHRHNPIRYAGALLPLGIFLFLLFAPLPAHAQVGGMTSADGPFVLEDAEDLNLTVESVGRTWVVDHVQGVKDPLQALSPNAAGITLAQDQTPQGALRFTMSARQGFYNYSFGVPVPGVVGASTLEEPGDITSFTHLKLLGCTSPTLQNRSYMVILETYRPETTAPPHPKLYWKFDLPPTAEGFGEAIINLRDPDLVEDAQGATVEELLSQTRYLAFYFYAESNGESDRLVTWLDDITLVNDPDGPGPPTGVGGWILFSSQTSTDSSEEMAAVRATAPAVLHP